MCNLASQYFLQITEARCVMRRYTITLLFITLFILSCVCCTSSNGTPVKPEDDTGGAGGANLPIDSVDGLTFLFIHHSTGEGFLIEGGMWDMLEDAGLEVHSRTYDDGWVGDNTDPEHFPVTFTEHYDDMVTWELSSGEQYDFVAFKSCFPASSIESDAMLEDYKDYYRTVRDVVRQHPETLFIPFSTPPLVPEYTEPADSARAREFANWLTGEYDDDDANLVAFDLFDILAGDNPSSGDYNCLRYEYQADPYDSHPNELANETVAEEFTSWLVGEVEG
mgnify:CR=1 FL=1